MNQINLVPVEYKKQQRRKWYVLFGALGGALVILILITLAFIPVFKIRSAKNLQEELTEELATKNMVETRMILDETEEAYISSNKASKLLEELDVPSHITRQTMDVVVGSVPRGLRMNEVRMDKDENGIVVAGYARSITKVGQYIVQLYNTEQFNIIEYTAGSIEESPVPGWMEYSITIQPRFFVEAEEKAEAAAAEEESEEGEEGQESDEEDEEAEEEGADEVL